MLTVRRSDIIKLQVAQAKATRKIAINVIYFQERTISKATIYISIKKIFLEIPRVLLHLFLLSMIMYPRHLQLPLTIKYKDKEL